MGKGKSSGNQPWALSEIPRSRVIFSHHGDSGALTWEHTGFGDGTYVLRLNGPAGCVEIALDDPRLFLEEILLGMYDDELNGQIAMISDRHYVRLSFATESHGLLVHDEDGEALIDEAWRPRAYGPRRAGGKVSWRGRRDLSAHMLLEVLEPVAEFDDEGHSDSDQRVRLVGMVGLERQHLERLTRRVMAEIERLTGERFAV